MVLLVFMWTWNEFLLALVMISDQTHRTAPLGLSASRAATAWISPACRLPPCSWQRRL